MDSVMLVWTILLGLASLIWLARHRSVSRFQKTQKPLTPESYSGPPAEAPHISVLVAAKDEEDNIEACVTSMLQQDYIDYEIIAIDDRSDDRTGAILDGIEAPAGRLKVLHVTELRDGWFGKNNAMRTGVEAAAGEWLCFIDADCRQTSPKTLSMAMRYAAEHQAEFVSLLPVLDTDTVIERIIQPVAAGLMVFWFHPERVNDPRSKVAYANGAFMLMSRPAYDAIGGHEPVKTEVNEDMHMARRAKERGLSLRVVQNRGLYVTRMYRTLGETWRGWSRIFYGCFGSFRRLLVSLIFLFTFSFLPWLSLAVGWVAVAFEGWERADRWRWIAIAATVAVLMQQSILVRYYRVSQARWWYAPTYWLGTAVVLGMLVSAMRKLGGRQVTVWRGTTYRGHQIAS